MRPDQLLVLVTARLEAIGVGRLQAVCMGRRVNTYDLDILVQLLP